MATKNIVPRSNNEGQLGRSGKRWAQGNFVTGSFTFISSSLIPHATNTYDLGSAANMWKDIYVSSGSIKFVNPSTSVVMHELKATDEGIVFQSGSGLVANVSGSTISGSALHIEGDGKITGDFTLGGNITLGDANTDSLSISADLTSHLVPNTDNTYDFGSTTKRWRNIYLSGSVSSSGGPHYFNSDTTVGITAVTTLTAKGNGGASFGDDVGTWEFDGAGALSETGMTTISMTPSSTLTLQGGGVSKYGDDTGYWSFDGSGAVSETGMTTFSLTPSSTVDIDAGGALTLDGSAITIGGDSDVLVDIDAAAFDVDASGALTIDSATSISIGTAADVAWDVDTAALDIDSSGAITIDGTSTVSIDGADDMNFTITSGTGGEDLTIQQIGANDSSIIITAAGTGTDAVSIDATAGDMVIAPTLINGKTLTIGPSSATQMVFTPHGTAANEKISLINTSGTADDAIKIDAEAGGLTLAAGNDSLHIDADGTDADALNIDSAGGIDVDAAGALAIDSATSISIGTAADVAWDVDTAALDIDSSGAITIDGTSTVAIAGASTSTYGDDTAVWSFNGSGALSETGMTTFSLTPSSTVDVDAGGAVTIDSSAAAISVGGDSVAQKISIGGDTSTRTEVELNAILVDVNAGSGGVTIDAGAASNLTTSGGAITVSGKTGVSIQEDGSDVIAIDTNRDVLFGQTGGSASDPDVEIDGYLKVDGSSTFGAPITASAAISSSGAMELASLTLDTDLAVAHGGTGASTLTDGGVLLGSGTSAVTAMAVLADGEFIVGDGTTDPVAESGNTARTSLGVGTGDSPAFSGLDINGAMTITGNITGDSGNMTVAASGGDTLIEGITFSGNDVTIPGTLTVQGTETIISSSALNVVDKNITIGSGSITSAVMDEGGLDFGLPTIANIRYDHSLTAISSSVKFYAPNISGSLTGSFGRTSTTDLDLDAIIGNWTNAGNTIADLGSVTTCDINGGTINGITDLVVADGGTGAGTFTDGGVLLGSGTDAITAMAVLADGEMIVGDGSGDPVAESGATLRTSIGVGTGDTPVFAGVEGGEINIGITGDNEIDTDSGNLTIDSDGGTVTVDDHLTVTGTLTESSTMEIKKNITTIDSGLDKVLLMRGVEFDYKEDDLHSIGVIAEEINKIEPYLLSEDKKSVQYTRIVPLLIEAIKDLSNKVDKQSKIIDTMGKN